MREQSSIITVDASVDQGNYPACVVCGGEEIPVLTGLVDTRFGVPGEYSACKCLACGLEQIFPCPKPDELKTLYERFYNFGGESGTTYTRWRDWFFTSPIYRMWTLLDGDGSFHGRKGKGRLLDIGCNEGRGLKIYRQNGFSPEGLELNPKAADVARRAGFTVHDMLIENFRPSDRYDVVVLSNVLEHSLNPKAMLEHIADILNPGGQIWISCPNSQSWLRKLFGAAWINWHVPFHITHFSAETLRKVLADTGFISTEVTQITPALWVSSSIIASVFARPGKSTRQLRNPLLVLALIGFARTVLFPFLYLGNRFGMGDCLVVVGKVSRNMC